LRSLDKLAKIGRAAVAEEMVEKAAVTAEAANRVIGLAELTGSNTEILERLESSFGKNAKAAEGIIRLRELVRETATAGVGAEVIQIDVAIARGLDYYTGTVYETILADLPNIGSVCSGGRYDNLASLYTKQVLPGVGASLGLDRLLAAMEELQLLAGTGTTAAVLITQFEAAKVGEYQRMARALRAHGIGVEVFPDAKKLGQQLAYGDKRGFRIALIAGPDEFAKGVWQIKDLRTQAKRDVPAEAVVEEVQRSLT
jgi:histidyl-tRNA synthetase